jgi:hypothetical protein
MRIRRMLWTMIALAALAWGQDSGEKVITRLIPVHYVNADHVRGLLSNIPGVGIKADTGMGVLVVSGRSDLVGAVEEMVKKLDVQPRDIELTVYLVSGSTQSPGDNLPTDLNSTAKQLHALFAYKGYKLLESFVVRGREGRRVETTGSLHGTSSTYSFSYNGASLSGDTSKVVHLEGLSLNILTPQPNGALDKNGNPQRSYIDIRTDLDAGEGQKVVVGKSNMNGTGDAVILVITAKVLE